MMQSSSVVAPRFSRFIENIRLTDAQGVDGRTKHGRVRATLNARYYGTSSAVDNSFLAGSWGKSTQTRPPRDIDIFFVLPFEVYERFEARQGNKQSQLLQEVKGVLAETYPLTNLRGDGQVVVVDFGSYGVEVVPAFKLTGGGYWICDTQNGGSYKKVQPESEADQIRESDAKTNGNTRDLIRMLKCWQAFCTVPLKSFWLELLAVDFLGTWEYAGKTSVYYDWMVRDFFAFLCARRGAFVIVPGTYEVIALGDAWFSRAESARGRAAKACDYESAGDDYAAGSEWQKVFGDDIPLFGGP